MQNSRKTGAVKFFNATKGYGFIIDDDTKNDVFVHVSDLSDPRMKNTLRSGDFVTFEIKDGKKGIKAVNVKNH